MALPCKRVRQKGYPSGMGLLQLFETQKGTCSAAPWPTADPERFDCAVLRWFWLSGDVLTSRCPEWPSSIPPGMPSESSSQGLVSGMIRQAGSLNRSDADVGQGDVLCLLHRSEPCVLDHLQEALMTMVRSEA